MDRYFLEPNQLKSFSKEENAFVVDYTSYLQCKGRRLYSLGL